EGEVLVGDVEQRHLGGAVHRGSERGVVARERQQQRHARRPARLRDRAGRGLDDPGLLPTACAVRYLGAATDERGDRQRVAQRMAYDAQGRERPSIGWARHGRFSAMARKQARESTVAPSGSKRAAAGAGSGLTVVSTPIGNLGDITLRALEALREADLVLCEDSRVTAKLARAHGITTPFFAYHEHNADRVRPALI